MPIQQTCLRPTWMEVDPQAFCQNVLSLESLLRPPVRVMVVLKADGYGHGAGPLARAVAALPRVRLWGFGVSSVEEGVSLRSAGLQNPILILGSLFPFESFETALLYGLTPTVASPAAGRACAKIASGLKRQASVHVKIDTGMGRIGVSPQTASQTFETIFESDALRLEGVYTHLAQADSQARTQESLALFARVVNDLRKTHGTFLAHAANSLATALVPESHHDLVRPGLALYGISPGEGRSWPVPLSPVMAWKTRVVFLKTVPSGTAVSYQGTFLTRRVSRLATLPVGYADGYRRVLSNRGQVLVKGRRCPVVGRVTMDQTIVDVTDVPDVDVGEEAVLLGSQGAERISVEEMAVWSDTIPYEIVCGISSRVPRLVLEGPQKGGRTWP